MQLGPVESETLGVGPGHAALNQPSGGFKCTLKSVSHCLGISMAFKSTSALLAMPKPLCESQQTVENLKEMGKPEHLTCLLRNLYAGQEATVRTGHGTTDWFQSGKEYINAVYCHPAYLTYMQSTS